MGLDFVEIIMQVEDAFGVKIEDEDLFEKPAKDRPEPVYHTTVGELYDLILEKRKTLGLPKGKVRPEVFAMRDVRLALADVLHMTPDEFRSQDRLSQLLPLDGRRKSWRRLRKRLRGLGSLKPRRTRFAYVRWFVCFVGAAAICRGFYYFGVFRPEKPTWMIDWPVLYLSSLALAILGMMTISDIWSANLIPKEARTVELLAKSHLARNRRHYIDTCGGADDDDDVWHTLQIILVDILDVEINEVTKAADLVRDLGAA